MLLKMTKGPYQEGNLQRIKTHLEQNKNFFVHDVKPDGDCLFECLRLSTTDSWTHSNEVRTELTTWVYQNFDIIDTLIKGDLTDNNAPAYADRMLDTNEWGREPEI